MNSLEFLIKDIRFFEAVSPVSVPISDAKHDIPLIKFIITEIELGSGVTGQGYILSFHYSAHAVKGALKDLSEFVKTGYSVNEIDKLLADYDRESEYFGREGLLKWPVAGLNIAMWDAWGKIKQQPVWQLLGGKYQKIEVYGSGGWLSYSDDALLQEVINYKNRGFPAIKIKVGSPQKGFDIRRLKKVREAVGQDMRIMMDANQGMTVASAVTLARDVEGLDIHWFEEPVNHRDFNGYREIKEQTSVFLAMGERDYDLTGLKILSKMKAIDMWQPDIARLGGVEGWLQSAQYANDHNIPVLPHFYKDYDAHLMCTIKNKMAVESFDWINDLIDNPLQIKEGGLYPHQQPGWGFSFLYDKMQRMQL